MKLHNVSGSVKVIFMIKQHSRLHTGAVGEKATEFISTCVHVADALPTSSKPKLQV